MTAAVRLPWWSPESSLPCLPRAQSRGAKSTPVQFEGRYGRHATSWFSFDLPVDQAHLMVLVVTYNRDERQRRAFEILVDGVKAGEQAVERRSPE